MATGTQIQTKCFEMDINLSEYSSSIGDSVTKAQSTENAGEICQGDTAGSKGDKDTSEKSGQTKKRYRSEKQKERTRQYKKKMRRAKKQMMREKKLAETNINDGHKIGDSWFPKAEEPETEHLSTRLLQTSGNKIEPGSTGRHKNHQTESLAGQVSLQLRPEVDFTRKTDVGADRFEDKILDNMNDDSLSLKPQPPQVECATGQWLTQTEDEIELEIYGVYKNFSKENLTEQVSVQVNHGINHTTQAEVGADMHENIKPDNNTKKDTLSAKPRESETGCATGIFLSPSEDKIESENIRTTNNPSRENLVEPASVQLRPAVNVTTEATADEARHKDSILDDNIRDRQDSFGILSVFVDSSIHYDYEKNSMVRESPANDFGYMYFSMKDFGKLIK